MDLNTIDHEDFDLGLLTVEHANELMGMIAAMPPNKRGMAMKKMWNKKSPITMENGSRGKMLRLLPYFPPEIRRGLMEKRLQLVDSEYYFVKSVAGVKNIKMIQDTDNKSAGLGNVSKQKLEKDNHFCLSGVVLLTGVAANKEDVTFDVIPHEIRNGEFEFKINGGKAITPASRVSCEIFDTGNRNDTRRGLWMLDNPKPVEAEQAMEFNIDFATAPAANTWAKAILIGSSVVPY
ncbi:MAG: hypothetical protein H0W84_08840 [Bacteroidetes bacterium]|nr:hypothetical protein [Bacteroidota bacterium]